MTAPLQGRKITLFIYDRVFNWAAQQAVLNDKPLEMILSDELLKLVNAKKRPEKRLANGIHRLVRNMPFEGGTVRVLAELFESSEQVVRMQLKSAERMGLLESKYQVIPHEQWHGGPHSVLVYNLTDEGIYYNSRLDAAEFEASKQVVTPASE